MEPLDGHDGPYEAPVKLAHRQVAPDWIDYNGHMNVAYYTMAFDLAIDEFLARELGMGEAHAARVGQGPYSLQNNISYFAELLEGAGFDIRVMLVDHDNKRMHLFMEMQNEAGQVAAVCEGMLMNVDHTTRRATPYAGWIKERLARMQASHDALPRPSALGAVIGIRRKG
ncbi:MAG: thioesterase family protein [Rhodobacteraceae bacterium]|nr:thioesterase family protein [Paracoccaceae bacterium]